MHIYIFFPNTYSTCTYLQITNIKKGLDEIYSEVVHWKKNTFLVPFGNAGKGFVLKGDGAAAAGAAMAAPLFEPAGELVSAFVYRSMRSRYVALMRPTHHPNSFKLSSRLESLTQCMHAPLERGKLHHCSWRINY